MPCSPAPRRTPRLTSLAHGPARRSPSLRWASSCRSSRILWPGLPSSSNGSDGASLASLGPGSSRQASCCRPGQRSAPSTSPPPPPLLTLAALCAWTAVMDESLPGPRAPLVAVAITAAMLLHPAGLALLAMSFLLARKEGSPSGRRRDPGPDRNRQPRRRQSAPPCRGRRRCPPRSEGARAPRRRGNRHPAFRPARPCSAPPSLPPRAGEAARSGMETRHRCRPARSRGDRHRPPPRTLRLGPRRPGRARRLGPLPRLARHGTIGDAASHRRPRRRPPGRGDPLGRPATLPRGDAADARRRRRTRRAAGPRRPPLGPQPPMAPSRHGSLRLQPAPREPAGAEPCLVLPLRPLGGSVPHRPYAPRPKACDAARATTPTIVENL